MSEHECKSPAERRCKAIFAAFGIRLSEDGLRYLEECFDRFGLKIIERTKHDQA